jgi:hypothetical protein
MHYKLLSQLGVGLLLVTATVVAFHSTAAAGNKDQKLITISATNAPLPGILKQLFNEEGASFSISPEITGSATLCMNGVPVHTALSSICRQFDLTYEVHDGVFEVRPEHPSVTVSAPIPVKPSEDEESQSQTPDFTSSQDGLALAVDSEYLYLAKGTKLYKVKKGDLSPVADATIAH